MVCKGHVGGIWNQVFLLCKLWGNKLCNRNLYALENITVHEKIRIMLEYFSRNTTRWDIIRRTLIATALIHRWLMFPDMLIGKYEVLLCQYIYLFSLIVLVCFCLLRRGTKIDRLRCLKPAFTEMKETDYSSCKGQKICTQFFALLTWITWLWIYLLVV